MEKLFSFYLCDNQKCEGLYAIDPNLTEEPSCPYCTHPYFSHVIDKVVAL